jgi:hypothetical protein
VPETLVLEKVALPLPDICVTALTARAERQDADRRQAADVWHDSELVFTSAYGT